MYPHHSSPARLPNQVFRVETGPMAAEAQDPAQRRAVRRRALGGAGAGYVQQIGRLAAGRWVREGSGRAKGVRRGVVGRVAVV